jgi:hypothetical protein
VSALLTNSAGNDCVAIGFQALALSTVSQLTAVGSGALQGNMGGLRNSAVGFHALQLNIGGNDNTAVGFQALQANTGNSNSAFGKDALKANMGGAGNTAVGISAGDTITTGNNNTLIGNGAGVDAVGALGRVAIGQGVTATIDDGLFFRPALALVGGAPPANVAYDTVSGQMGPTASSARFKKDIVALEKDFDSADVFKLRAVAYTLKTGATREFGFLAEDVAEVLPSIVPRDAEGRPYSVNYDRITVMLVEELRKARDIIVSLGDRIAVLEGKNK